MLSCNTCESLEDHCTSCADDLDFNEAENKCISCIEKIHGCGKCSDDSCDSCLKSFKKVEDDKCEKEIDLGFPKFKPVGFGLYRKDSKKIQFRLYLRVTSGMIYELQLKIFLTVITNNRRTLEENEEYVEGDCTLRRAAEGSLKEEPTLKGSTASLDCVSYYDKNEYFTEVKLKNATITSLNEDKLKDTKVNANAAFKINIVEQKDAKYDEDIPLYVFEQNYQTCKCKDGIANFKLKGTIENYKDKEIKGEIYTLTTSEKNDAKCNLTKDANSDEVTLDCQVETSTEKFDFITGEDIETNSESSIALEMNDDSVLCSESNGSSSSSGLSGGAVAGIVIGSIAGVLVLAGIAVLVAFAVKTTGAAAATAAAGTISSAGSEAAFPVSTISSNKIPV